MTNIIGHGHVIPRDDGYKAKCGGPAVCGVCQSEERRARPRLATQLDHFVADVESIGFEGEWMRHEISAVTPGMTWQPIETAPKEDYFLVYAHGAVFMAQRSGNYSGFAIAYDGQALEPTHWMPLPPPPEPT